MDQDRYLIVCGRRDMVNQMKEKDFSQILAGLRELGGYFVWRDEAGEAYVILSKREFEAWHKIREPEVQLSLPATPGVTENKGAEAEARADYVLERINREIALYQLRQQEDMIQLQDPESEQPEKPARVRFEPLRGDLPPELQ